MPSLPWWRPSFPRYSTTAAFDKEGSQDESQDGGQQYLAQLQRVQSLPSTRKSIENAERQREICYSLSVQKGSVRNAERQRERMCLCFECVEVFTFGSSQYVSIGYKPCVGGGAEEYEPNTT